MCFVVPNRILLHIELLKFINFFPCTQRVIELSCRRILTRHAAHLVILCANTSNNLVNSNKPYYHLALN
jgi:hypothetical protein